MALTGVRAGARVRGLVAGAGLALGAVALAGPGQAGEPGPPEEPTGPGDGVVVAAASPALVDRAVAAGISLPSTPSWDVSVVDVDLDGDEDFSMSLHMRNAGELRRNDGGTFTRAAAGVLMPRPSPEGGLVDRHACTWADFDRNGLPDAYCSAGRYASNRYKTAAIDNELFLQGPLASFRETAASAGVGEPCTRGRHVAALDVNGDGWQDLFLGAQNPRNDADDPCDDQPGAPANERSKVFVNRGASGGTWLGFRVGTEWGVGQANSGNRLALPWDFNRDGRVDLLTSSFADRTPYLYRNTGTSFVEVARSGTVRLPAFNGAALADLTGDGVLDLLLADGSGFGYRAGTATGVSSTTVRIGTVPQGTPWRLAAGDVDGDGDLDVYGLVASSTGSGNPADFVYVRTATGWDRHEVPAAGGDANDVAAVHVGARAQFVVLNGGNDESESAGPVQLIAWAGP